MKKKLLSVGMVMGALVLLVLGAAVPFSSFTPSQFGTNNNNVSIKAGSLMTNIFFYDNQGNQFWYTNSALIGTGGQPQLGNPLNEWDVYGNVIYLQGTNILDLITSSLFNTNQFGTNPPGQVHMKSGALLTNTHSTVATITNLVLPSESPSSSGSIVWSNGNLYLNYPSVVNSWFVNKNHGGIGDGSEWQFSANLIYMGPQNGGHMQIGLGSQTAIVQYMQFATPPSGDIHKGHSHLFGWRAGYDVPPAYSVFRVSQWNTKATNYDNVDGHGKWMMYSPLLPDQVADTSLGTNIFNFDSHGWAEAQSYRSFNYEPTWTGTNLIVSMLKDVQNFVLATNANVTLTDVLLTNLVWRGDLFFFSPFQGLPIAFPTTWNWESESGLAVSPTNVPGSNFLHVHVTYSIGTATNIIANYKSGSYTPVVDADAAAFIAAASITDGTEKAAVNRLVLDLKAASLWTEIYALYPFVGSTSNTCSWNLKDTTTFRIGWPTPPTFNGNGITGNGTTMYGDTHFKPSTDSTINSAGIFAYVRTTTPTDGGTFIGAVSTTGGQTFQTLLRSGANLAAGGLNFNGGTSVASASSDLRGNNGIWRTASTTQIIAHNTTHTGGDATVTSVNMSQNLLLLARAFEGFSPDNFSNANLGAAAITKGLSDAQITAFYTCMTTFEGILGRQVP